MIVLKNSINTRKHVNVGWIEVMSILVDKQWDFVYQ